MEPWRGGVCMAGGSTSNWADAVSAALERLDVAETIEELRRQIDELIGRLAQEDAAAAAPPSSASERLDVDVDELGRKVEGASDLLAELADVLESQTERIETIEQQLGDADRGLGGNASLVAGDGAGRQAVESLGARLECFRDLIDRRLGGIESRLGRIEGRLDDMLALAGEGQRQVSELQEQLYLHANPVAAQPDGLAEYLGDADASLVAPVIEFEPGKAPGETRKEKLSAAGREAETGEPGSKVQAASEQSGELFSAQAAASEASDVALAAAMSRAEQDIARAAALAASLTRSTFGPPVGGNGRAKQEAASGNGRTEAARVEAMPEPPLSGAHSRAEAAPGLGPSQVHPGKPHPTVLVVDDVADARMILSVYLSKTGYQVVTASSAEDCLAKLRHHDVDAIVLDARMPGGDGRHVCRVLAEDPDFEMKKNTPVIVYTGHPQEFSRDEVVAWGASDYVVKGGDMLPLISALVRYTGPLQEEAQ